MKPFFISFNLFLIFANPLLASVSFAYSAQGHEGIAEFAHTHVNAQTRAILDQYFLKDNEFVKRINQMQATLSAGAPTASPKFPADDLGKISIWADSLKFALRRMAGSPLLGDAKAAAFNSMFPKNGDWHFLNLPLDTVQFAERSPFNPNQMNVVDAINGAIQVLEGKASGYASVLNHNAEFTKSQALFLLVHLVGDIHQPLHVGCGYYELPNSTGANVTRIDVTNEVLITQPAQATLNGKLLPSDNGGNSVHYGAVQTSGTEDSDSEDVPSAELHALWDDGLVQNYAGTKDKNSHTLALQIANHVTSLSPYQTTDANGNALDYHGWAAEWASESAHAAKQAYSGLTFNSVILGPHRDITAILVSKSATYEQDHAREAAAQLEKAGAHLTLLLNSIHWDLTGISDETADPNFVPVKFVPKRTKP